MEEQKTELKMIRMSEVQSQEVKWLWYPFIPYGKLTIVQGDPVSDGTLWEVQTALYFRQTCLPDCAVSELAADSQRIDRRLS